MNQDGPDGSDGTAGGSDAAEGPTRWSAPVTAVLIAAVAAFGLGAWAVAADDPPGRVLAGLAALALAAGAVFGALARPRLAVDPAGLSLRGPFAAARWPWSCVDAVRVVRARRLGLPTAYVEVEARDDAGDERLLVLGRLELGADPVEVAAELQRHRAAAGRRGPEDAGAQ